MVWFGLLDGCCCAHGVSALLMGQAMSTGGADGVVGSIGCQECQHLIINSIHMIAYHSAQLFASHSSVQHSSCLNTDEPRWHLAFHEVHLQLGTFSPRELRKHDFSASSFFGGTFLSSFFTALILIINCFLNDHGNLIIYTVPKVIWQSFSLAAPSQYASKGSG
jgi:hypothetical protein